MRNLPLCVSLVIAGPVLRREGTGKVHLVYPLRTILCLPVLSPSSEFSMILKPTLQSGSLQMRKLRLTEAKAKGLAQAVFKTRSVRLQNLSPFHLGATSVAYRKLMHGGEVSVTWSLKLILGIMTKMVL